MSAKPPKIRYSHEAVIDMLIVEPGVTQREIASRIGYSESWLSTVMCSDAFQARLAERREEVVDPLVKMTLQERFRALTTRGLDVLQEKLSGPASLVPDNLALRAVELGAKAGSIGGFGNAAPIYTPPPADYLEQLKTRLLDLQRQCRPPIEGEVIDVQPS
jgi:hypothetical protein